METIVVWLGGNNQIPRWGPNLLGAEARDPETQVVAVNGDPPWLTGRDRIWIQGWKTMDTALFYYATWPHSAFDFSVKSDLNQLRI